MNWQHFQTYNEAETRAFEVMCNQLFELWANREYKESKQSFVVVNGSGGDGGVESYVVLKSGEEIGVQAKWFPNSITSSQFHQIKKSILTAIEVHSQLIKYIVCVPRDLSNEKKGKDGKIVKDTEYSRWEKVVADIKDKYPKVEVIPWGEYELGCQLQYAEAAGVRRYWFEKEEITKDALQYSFDKQKHGWLDQRYISVLHNRGIIYKEILSFLGNTEECSSILKELETTGKNYEILVMQIDKLCGFLRERKKSPEKIKELEELRRRIKNQCVELKSMKEAFRNEYELEQWNEEILTYEKLWNIKEWLDKEAHGGHYFHFWDVKKTLEKIDNENMFQLLERMKQRCNFDKIIVIGGPGTGKTHGIANMVETQLSQECHIPILIQAKSVAPQDEWKDMLIRTLGLSEVWSEDELWSALEALSYRNEIHSPMSDMENDIHIIPKVVIYIDGIDESKPYSRWHERINQADVITSRHTRIRFCFTGRQYAFVNKKTLHNKEVKRIILPDEGDTPVRKIYDDYIRHYDIDDKGAKWIRYSINTPYELKLLCELYEGKNIRKIDKSDITIAKLLREKFDRLNREFKYLVGIDEETDDQIVKKALLRINELFENQNRVTRTQIKSVLRESEIYYYLEEPGLDKILDFLSKYDFLQSYEQHAESFFQEDETIYFLGTQPTYDYLKALRQYEKEYSDDLKLDIQVLENIGALQIYAVMIIDKYGKVLWNNKSCREYLNEEDLFSVTAFALVNVNDDISVQYVEWIKELMRGNAYALSLTVNKIVLPLARIEKHPLGSKLLDQCLADFAKPAERDIIWSIPSNLKGNDDSLWVRYDDIEYANESYKLENTDCFDGMPLVWAWGLTSVDNGQRTMIRQEITKWGIAQPEEFYKLFEYFAYVNDIQTRTDIFAIAMAVAHMCRKKHDFLKLISKWIYHNIFLYKKIKDIHNAAIRYYSRAIMECAFSEGIITEARIIKCRPPYRIGASLLPFSVEATEGTMMAGYKTMDYDVARYVLCEPLGRKFFNNRNYAEEIEKIVKKYGRKYHLPKLTSEKWILGSAFGQIEAAGWSEDIFYGKPNGGRIGERLGLDIAISRKFGVYSHGSMSRIMTIAEKYSWCAKMELLGYLADRLPFYDYESCDEHVSDYGKLEDYVNPYQELRRTNIDKVMDKTNWILPEDLTPSIQGCAYNELGIQKWLNESGLPDFEKWINIRQEEITLFASHFMSNEEQGVTTMMWISSGLIQKDTISSFVKAIKEKDFAVNLVNTVNIVAYPVSDHYVSPLEVCWFDWKNENNSMLEYGNNTLYKNVAKCTCFIQGKGEIEYELPSKKVRKMMGIISGDGYNYYNDAGIEVAHYREAGEDYDDCQRMLLVNKEIFLSQAHKLGLQPVWFIRVLKEISGKARERFGCFMEKDETYLVWKNNKRWEMRKIEYIENDGRE